MNQRFTHTERAILVGLETPAIPRQTVEEHLRELAQLAITAGATVIHTLAQKRSHPHPAYYIGRGKAGELRHHCQADDIDLVVFDDELSPAQIKNLQVCTGRRVLDRTELIMDIFAMRAKSREGKVQVELAQLKYMLPRLTRAWTHLSRQEGGIGTRGPGETQLEIDRRRVRSRIKRLTDTLQQIERERTTQRRKRRRQGIPVVALVGYTNAGKSTMMNALTGANVLVENKLFATLDTTTRHLSLPGGRKVLLTDTVGFIRKLPHHLIESFKATLEGVVTADLLLHVIDSSHGEVEEQMNAVWNVLKELGAVEKPIIAVFNKIDKLGNATKTGRYQRKTPRSVAVSALTGEGLDELLSEIEAQLNRNMIACCLAIPQKEAGLVSHIYETGTVHSCMYEGNDILIEADLPVQLFSSLRKFVLQE